LSILKNDQLIALAFTKQIGESNAEPFMYDRENILAQIRLKLGTDVYYWGDRAGEVRETIEECIKKKAKESIAPRAIDCINKMSEQTIKERILKLLDEHPEFFERFLD
jgi:hypothetical protein